VRDADSVRSSCDVGVAQKDPCAGCRILICGVGKKRPGANGCVEVGFGIGQKCKQANRRIVCAGRKTKKRILSFRAVLREKNAFGLVST